MKNFLMAATALGGVVLFAGNALAASEYECRNYAQSQADAYAPNGAGRGRRRRLRRRSRCDHRRGHRRQCRDRRHRRRRWRCGGRRCGQPEQAPADLQSGLLGVHEQRSGFGPADLRLRRSRRPTTASSGGWRPAPPSTAPSSGTARTPASSRASTAPGTGAACRRQPPAGRLSDRHPTAHPRPRLMSRARSFVAR